MSSSRLASLLVQDGHVSAPRIGEAFQRQVIYGGTLDTIVLEMGLVDEAIVVEYLGRAAGLPAMTEMPQGDLALAAVAIPADVAEKHRVIPISVEGSTVQVLVTDPPPDRLVLEKLTSQLRVTLVARVVPEYRLYLAMEKVYALPIPARYASLSAKLRNRPPAPARPKPQPQPPQQPLEETGRVERLPAAGDRNTLEMQTLRRVELEELLAVPQIAPTETTQKSEPKLIIVSTLPERGEEPSTEITIGKDKDDDDDAQIVIESRRENVVATPPRPVEEPPITAADAPSGPVAAPASAATALPVAEGMRLLDDANDRDEVFALLCRMGRSRFDYVMVFTIQAEQAVARLGLSDRWLDRRDLQEATISMGAPSSLRATVQGRAPYLGQIGIDPLVAAVMERLGRKPPRWGALLPIVIRGRTVAVVYADAGGKVLDASQLVDLIHAANEASQAFQRIILRAKTSAGGGGGGGGGGGAGAPSPTTTKPRGDSTLTGTPPAPKKDTSAAAPQVAESEITAPVAAGRPITAVGLGSGTPLDLEALIALVAADGSDAAAAAEAIIGAGEAGARALVAHLPGPLRIRRLTLTGPIPPLSQHGPLMALVPRVGRLLTPHLLWRLADPSADVRFYMALALSETPSPAAVSTLGSRLLDNDAGVRRAAAIALGRCGPSPALHELLEALRAELNSPDIHRQRLIAEALGELRDAASVPRLIEMVRAQDELLVANVRRALTTITKQDFDTSRWKWRTWWEANRGHSRLDWLLDGLRHEDPVVRQSASDELEVINTEHYGYHVALPRPAREDARQKWATWYKSRGVSP